MQFFVGEDVFWGELCQGKKHSWSVWGWEFRMISLV